jgi:uncharacterized protein YqeY
MTLRDRLSADLKDAMRAKDAVRLRTIRSLRSAIQSADIDARGGDELDEDALIAVVAKQAKQRRDAIAQYQEAGRDDLVVTEQEELEIIETYLPEQMSDDELAAAVDAIVAQTGASGMGDMGRVMGQAMGRLKGKAEGARVQQAVRERLSQ